MTGSGVRVPLAAPFSVFRRGIFHAHDRRSLARLLRREELIICAVMVVPPWEDFPSGVSYKRAALARDFRTPRSSTTAGCGSGSHRHRTSHSRPLGSNQFVPRLSTSERRSKTTATAKVVRGHHAPEGRARTLRRGQQDPAEAALAREARSRDLSLAAYCRAGRHKSSRYPDARTPVLPVPPPRRMAPACRPKSNPRPPTPT